MSSLYSKSLIAAIGFLGESPQQSRKNRKKSVSVVVNAMFSKTLPSGLLQVQEKKKSNSDKEHFVNSRYELMKQDGKTIQVKFRPYFNV